jgi:hypothetical protein
MALNRAFVASQPRFAKSPLLPGTEKTGFINLSIKVGGTLAQPTDTFLSEFGLETGLPGSQNENQDGVELWEEFGTVEEGFTPELMRDPNE